MTPLLPSCLAMRDKTTARKQFEIVNAKIFVGLLHSLRFKAAFIDAHSLNQSLNITITTMISKLTRLLLLPLIVLVIVESIGAFQSSSRSPWLSLGGIKYTSLIANRQISSVKISRMIRFDSEKGDTML